MPDPGLTGEAYPEVFTIPPPQPTEKKPGQLTPEQLKHFFEEGYVLLENFFTDEELQPLQKSVADQIDDLANKLKAAGRIKDTYSEYPISTRLIYLEKEFPPITAVLTKKQRLDEATKGVWTNDRLLNVMEQILGPEISVHPVWSFRTKTPHNTIIAVPWHQDSAYFGLETYKHILPVAWMPMHDTNGTTGCLQIAKKAHKKGKIVQHTGLYKNSPYMILEEETMEKELGVDFEKDLVTCEVPYRGVLIFNNLTPHQALQNKSDRTRISFDLRFQNSDKPFGYYGIQDGTQVRSARNPDLKVDWDPYDKKDRKVIWEERFLKEEYKTDDEFDPTITGPWLSKWTMKYHNMHTDACKVLLPSSG